MNTRTLQNIYDSTYA